MFNSRCLNWLGRKSYPHVATVDGCVYKAPTLKERRIYGLFELPAQKNSILEYVIGELEELWPLNGRYQLLNRMRRHEI